MFRKKTLFVEEEFGFSLIEVLASIIILGISLTLMFVFINNNNQMIEFNRTREEAIEVRQDIKEWFSYRAQTEDIVNLNQFVLTQIENESSNLEENEKMRRQHLILDNSGIQYDGVNRSVYGEIPIDESNPNRGKFLYKIKYAPGEPEKLGIPENLRLKVENQYYLGVYLDENRKETDYLVRIDVNRKSTNSNSKKDGIEVNVEIYNRKTGKFLTETIFNWVPEY
ncbi:MAG: prepilin-type N-terminal cleavage/methylation domain-containing protein [Lactobacillales bacterium]|jgi:prepilin-type N-terminal cleavage/methylation domain-containing protein|nr:prepilin-type N-terminal cleavage/methylation domain-containing protein [Lactobacillales bacterium]